MLQIFYTKKSTKDGFECEPESLKSMLPTLDRYLKSTTTCPVDLLKQHLSRRHQELRDKGPFYLAIIENPKTNVWYKKQRLVEPLFLVPDIC